MNTSKNEIVRYFHCAKCINELPPATSPRSWAQLECGWTKKGIQVWCKRHDINVANFDFMGQKVRAV